jgi:RNA polymerase sigma factor (sigma-70 family)
MEPLDQLAQSDEIFQAMAAMNRLPKRQPTVLHLIACEEMSVSETAQALQISPEAVRASLSVARAQMRRLLLPHEDNSQHIAGKEQT